MNMNAKANPQNAYYSIPRIYVSGRKCIDQELEVRHAGGAGLN